jgi:hypothetical protein
MFRTKPTCSGGDVSRVHHSIVFILIDYHSVNGELEGFTDAKQSLYDSYSPDVQNYFPDHVNTPKKEALTPGVLGGKRKVCTPTSRNIRPVPIDIDRPRSDPESSDSRMTMHHLMQYTDSQTKRGHTIVIFMLFPGTDIKEIISKDGREVAFRIQTPDRLAAKQFANTEKISADDYDVDEDDQRQCMMTYFKTYEPEEYIYRVQLPDPIMTHPDYLERWWSFAHGGRVLVSDYTHQCDEDFSFAIQSLVTE